MFQYIDLNKKFFINFNFLIIFIQSVIFCLFNSTPYKSSFIWWYIIMSSISSCSRSININSMGAISCSFSWTCISLFSSKKNTFLYDQSQVFYVCLKAFHFLLIRSLFLLLLNLLHIHLKHLL